MKAGSGVQRRRALTLAAALGAWPDARTATLDTDAFARWTAGRFRGFTTDNLPHISASTLQALARTGGNVARVGIDFLACADCAGELPPAMAERVVATLEAARQVGVGVVFLGNFDIGGEQPLWHQSRLQDGFVAAWRAFARTAGNHPALAGLDLMNEPHPPMPDGRTAAPQARWSALALRAIDAVRAAGCSAPIVFEPVAGGSTLGMDGLEPLPRRGVVYSFHFYTPHEITHQGVSPRWQRRIPYPADASWGLGAWDAKLGVGAIDAERLHAELQPVRTFAQRYRLPVYVGEFGCVRWAPDGSALRWVRDCLALFESEKWHWSFHSFRTWPGWDAEIDADEPPSSRRRTDSAPLMQLLRRTMALPA
jgi:endoglucanase